MAQVLIDAVFAVAILLASIALFAFVVTRGALLLRALAPGAGRAKTCIYPIYTDIRLIRLIDYQPLFSAILLFQYHRLVARITADLGRTGVVCKTILITCCAFDKCRTGGRRGRAVRWRRSRPRRRHRAQRTDPRAKQARRGDRGQGRFPRGRRDRDAPGGTLMLAELPRRGRETLFHLWLAP